MATQVPSSLKISRVRISSILLFALFSSLISPSSAAKIPYYAHCASLVPESPPTVPPTDPTPSFRLSAGYFAGGDRILGTDPNSTFSIPRSLSFRLRSLLRTLSQSTLKLTGTLVLRGGGIRISRPRGRGLRLQINPRYPHTFAQRGVISFDLDGFWSESAGKLCMVGTGFGRSPGGTALELNAVFKLNYPNSSTISTSVVAGVLESVDEVSSANYFDPIRVLAYVQKDYEFTKLSDAVDSCAKVKVVEELLGFEFNKTCGHLSTLVVQKFRLGYGGSCSGSYCGPFDRGLGFYPSLMGLNQVQCLGNGRLRMYIVFTDREHFGFSKIMLPKKSLVAEGVWNHENERLCLVACNVLNFSSSLAEETAGDCTIRLTLWFPSVLSIGNMSMASGCIWSTRDRSDSKYFDKVSIGVVENRMINAPGVKYNYTQMDRVKKVLCKE